MFTTFSILLDMYTYYGFEFEMDLQCNN